MKLFRAHEMRTSKTDVSMMEISNAGLLATLAPDEDETDGVYMTVCSSPNGWASYRDAVEWTSNDYDYKVNFLRRMSDIIGPRVLDLRRTKSREDSIGGSRGSLSTNQGDKLGYWVFWFPNSNHVAIFIYSKDEQDSIEKSLDDGLRSDLFALVHNLMNGDGEFLDGPPEGHPANDGKETLH